MPLIYRKTTHKTLTTMAKIHTEYTKYIHPSRALKEGDRLVPLNEISDRQLAELAAKYPTEYLEAAQKRRVAPAELKPRSNVHANAAEEDESKPAAVPGTGRPSLKPLRGEASAPRGPLNRGAKIPAPSPDDDDLDGDPETPPAEAKPDAALSELEAMFVKMPMAEAIDLITTAAAQGRQKVLVKLLDAELLAEKPRKGILKAFDSVGIAIPNATAAEGDGEGEGDGAEE